ncbi:DUF262 domain-containing protein [Lentibacillus sediminis]|uniref:DUF262 domain-containing protein n=1 Tax=Lentibacillus sediminis TaxID=1940529 RepID=UPI0013043126|nr:DUF262 domain-containing protein [Lentibacillus sediminis]
MQLDPKFYSFDELLQKRLFEIPEYQRAYSWTTKQRKDLFNDIEKLYNYEDYKEGRTHFMATVVCHDKDKVEEYETDIYRVLDIVDGQQRITTLIILLKALHMKLTELNNPKYRRTIMNLDEILVKDEDNRLILIQANHDSSLALRDYLTDGRHPSGSRVTTHATKNLKKAFEECESFVEEWNNKYNLLDLLILLKSKLYFILHIIDDEGAVYTVFEVLNSRGLEVDWLDKCKSILMGIAFEKLKGKSANFNGNLEWLHKYWSQIYKAIGITNLNGGEIVKFTATLFHPDKKNKPLKEEDAIEFFKSICTRNPEKVVDVSKWILDVATELKEIFTNPRIEAVSQISHARLAAIAIKLSEHIDEVQREMLLDQWERVTFRIFGLFQKDSRYKVGEYTRLSNFIMGIKDLTKKVIDENYRFKKAMEEFIKISEDFSMKQMIKELNEKDCYNSWGKELRYFFYHYEEYLAKNKGYHFPVRTWESIWSASANETIEHVYPQNESAAWKGKVIKRKEFHANRLGNLMILPRKLNSKIKNNGFNDKKIEYAHSEMLSTKEILNYNDWDIRTIEKRTFNLLEWASVRWENILKEEYMKVCK